MSEFIEARCPKCRNVKDPAQKMCGPCSLMTKVESEAKLRATLDKIPMPVLVLIGLLLLALRHAALIACVVIAVEYYGTGKPDLSLIWVMLGILSIPTRKSESSPKASE